MGSKFQKKNLARLKKESEAILDRDLEDFDGTKTELFFIKLGRKIQRNRLQVFGSVLAVFLIVSGVLGYLEYTDYRENKATQKLEVLLESWEKNPSVTPAVKIQVLENFLDEDSFGVVDIRVAKTLADFLSQEGEYAKAAKLLEDHGVKIEGYRESKAYYFYLAGNYRELAGDKDMALKDYETSSSLLENLRETPSFRAWSLYHSGRLNAEKGDNTKASESLKKVLLIEPGEAGTDLTEVKKLSTFLLLRMSQKD